MQRLLFLLTDGYGHRSVFFKAQIFLFKVAANKSKSRSVDIVCSCVCVFLWKGFKILDVFMLSSEKGNKEGQEISFGPFLFNMQQIQNMLLYSIFIQYLFSILSVNPAFSFPLF